MEGRRVREARVSKREDRALPAFNHLDQSPDHLPASMICPGANITETASHKSQNPTHQQQIVNCHSIYEPSNSIISIPAKRNSIRLDMWLQSFNNLLTLKKCLLHFEFLKTNYRLSI